MTQSTSSIHAYSLLMDEDDKRHYILIKDFNTLMYNHTLHCGKKYFFCYCLYAFSSTEILKSHANINGKQMIQMPKKREYVRFIGK